MLEYEHRGDGPSVVLVHGITESRRVWDPLVPALASTFDVTAVDLRGHGASGSTPPFDLVILAADVHQVVAHLGIDRPLVVGHSLGATVATAYAALFPTRGVVNIDQSLALASFQAALLQIEPFLRGDEAGFQQTVSAVFDAMRGPLGDDEWDRIRALRRADQTVVLAIWSVLLDSSPGELDQMVEETASRITVPYLSLHGADPGPDYSKWLRALVPTSEYELWDGDGHYPHLVEPERFVERLRAFDAGTLGGG